MRGPEDGAMTFEQFQATAKRKGNGIQYAYPFPADPEIDQFLEKLEPDLYFLEWEGSYEAERLFLEWILYGYVSGALISKRRKKAAKK